MVRARAVGRAAGGASGDARLTAIERAAELLARWSGQVDETHAQPGTVEMMRALAADVRAEYSELSKSPGAAFDTLIKTWAARELERLPRGAWGAWIRTGVIPRALQAELTGLPEAVAALIGSHVADEIDDCEICKRRAPCRLISDGTESGERDWRCAWGCPAPPHDPATTAMLLEWAKECGL
jgi:hypothetical protein